MKKKTTSKLIVCIDIIVFLILFTWTIMGWPHDLGKSIFWLFIVIALFEGVIVAILGNVIKFKKKKDNKGLQLKKYNISLIVIGVVLFLLACSLSFLFWVFAKTEQYANYYPEGTMTYTKVDYDKDIVIPSYSIFDNEYWDEVIVFYSPKDANQLKKELDDIFNSSEFVKYETDSGDVYYNQESDYTIVDYQVNEKLFMNSFNLVYCDGLCN